jgi:hypothetical protein
MQDYQPGAGCPSVPQSSSAANQITGDKIASATNSSDFRPFEPSETGSHPHTGLKVT